MVDTSKGEVIQALISLSAQRKTVKGLAETYLRTRSKGDFRNYVQAVDNCFILLTRALRASQEKGTLKQLR